MVINGLDHVRDFFSNRIHMDPTDLKTTTAAIFLTRWITIICSDIHLPGGHRRVTCRWARGKSKHELACSCSPAAVAGVLRTGHQPPHVDVQFRFYSIRSRRLLGDRPVDGRPVVAGLPSDTVVTITGIALILFHNLLDGVTATQVTCRIGCGRSFNSPGQ